jgi:CheY-like chemotaxis protein
MENSALHDRRILVVEDEYLIALNLADSLEVAGATVIGPVASVDMAVAALASEARIDAAVLDVNLGGLVSYPVADALIERKIPFVFTSGYEDSALRTRYPQVRACSKPYQFPSIEKALVEALSSS